MFSDEGETVIIPDSDTIVNWFFDNFNIEKEKFETGSKEKYNIESFLAKWGIDGFADSIGTVQFFDDRTYQLIQLYEFYKYNPAQFSELFLWRECVTTLRRLEPKGGLF